MLCEEEGAEGVDLEGGEGVQGGDGGGGFFGVQDAGEEEGEVEVVGFGGVEGGAVGGGGGDAGFVWEGLVLGVWNGWVERRGGWATSHV